mgnify:CR=1 FL=1
MVEAFRSLLLSDGDLFSASGMEGRVCPQVSWCRHLAAHPWARQSIACGPSRTRITRTSTKDAEQNLALLVADIQAPKAQGVPEGVGGLNYANVSRGHSLGAFNEPRRAEVDVCTPPRARGPTSHPLAALLDAYDPFTAMDGSGLGDESEPLHPDNLSPGSSTGSAPTAKSKAGSKEPDPDAPPKKKRKQVRGCLPLRTADRAPSCWSSVEMNAARAAGVAAGGSLNGRVR